MKRVNLLGKLLITSIIFSVGFTSLSAQCSHSSKTAHHHKYETNKADIVDLAVSDGQLSTLVAALKAADLTEVLDGQGPFTVFAPTDAAFAALPEGTIDELLKPENKDKLVKILTYHVIPGRVESTDLKDGQTVASVEGSNIMVETNSKVVKINDALVVKADQRATNGVIHFIDRVIIPPNI
ncbi:MAG: fasciclin domain-containing protein [Bacteroidia bacterium]|nr:fasciclin domain-containing protein [Bacteroidia bacterium]